MASVDENVKRFDLTIMEPMVVKSRIDVPSLFEEPAQYPPTIPKEGSVGRVVDVCLNQRGIGAQVGAANAALPNRVPTQEVIDLQPRLGLDGFEAFVEESEVHDLARAETRETLQKRAVVKSHHGVS